MEKKFDYETQVEWSNMEERYKLLEVSYNLSSVVEHLEEELKISLETKKKKLETKIEKLKLKKSDEKVEELSKKTKKLEKIMRYSGGKNLESEKIIRHSKDVAIISREILDNIFKTEKASDETKYDCAIRVVIKASLLHDMSKFQKDHEVIASKRILDGKNVLFAGDIFGNSSKKELISNVVSYHCGDKISLLDGENLTFAKIVHDSDKISKILKLNNSKEYNEMTVTKLEKKLGKKLKLEESLLTLNRYLNLTEKIEVGDKSPKTDLDKTN